VTDAEHQVYAEEHICIVDMLSISDLYHLTLFKIHYKEYLLSHY